MKKMMLMAAMAVFCLGMNAQQPQKKSENQPAKTEQCCKKKVCKDCKDAKCKEAKCKDCKCGGCCKKSEGCKDGQKKCCKKKEQAK